MSLQYIKTVKLDDEHKQEIDIYQQDGKFCWMFTNLQDITTFDTEEDAIADATDYCAEVGA